MGLRKKIQKNIQRTHRGLEFGPSFNPIVRKAEGFNVVVVDHASKEELLQKYRDEPVELDRIEAVDVIWKGQDLRGELECGKFDYIVASHVIEHVPCLISFLRLCQDLLREDGKLFLLVPDKRFCFDVFRPITSLGLVLDAWFERRTRPAPYQIFDQNNYSASCLGSPNWSSETPRSFAVKGEAVAAFDLYQAARSDDTYRDVHCWTFVPSSFRLIISELRRLGLIALGEIEFGATDGCEFYVCLSRSAEEAPERRKLELLCAQLEESGFYGQGVGAGKVIIVGRAKAVIKAYVARYPRLKLALKRFLRGVRG